MHTETNSPAQDAVVAFCCLVRALKERDAASARECREALRRCGFNVRVCRSCAVKKGGAPCDAT